MPREVARKNHQRTISLNSELSLVRSPTSGAKFSCGETQISKRVLTDEEESDIPFTGGQTLTSELNLVTEEELTSVEIITQKEFRESKEERVNLVENLEVIGNAEQYDTRRSTKAGTLESGRSSGRSLLTKYLENNALRRMRNDGYFSPLQQSQNQLDKRNSQKVEDQKIQESVSEGGHMSEIKLRAMTENAEYLSRPCSRCEKNLQKSEELQKALYRALDLSSALLNKVVKQERELQKHRSMEPKMRNQLLLK